MGKLTSSILSFKERGNDGKSSYRGNCSGYVIEALIDQYNIKEISDYMCGSGTTEDVAKRKHIISHCYDLNRGFDLLNDEIKEVGQKHIFWHPPYHDIITYSDSQYSAKEVIDKFHFDPRKSDLSRCNSWEEFIEKLNYCTMKQFATLDKGGRLYILMGDIKKKGVCYSMLSDIVKPGSIENILIKAQHNCVSDSKTYANTNFIPITHEYLLILRKDEPFIIRISYPVYKTTDLRDIRCSTWKQIIYMIMKNGKKTSYSIDELYELLRNHKKARNNSHVREKIRQVLNQNNEFAAVARGVWKIA